MDLQEFVDSVKKSYKGKNEDLNFYFMRSQLADLYWTVKQKDPEKCRYSFNHLQDIHRTDNFKLVISNYWFEFIRPSYQAVGSRSAFYKDGKRQIKDYLKGKPKKLEDYKILGDI